jgi:hypothetical protein
VALLIVVEAVTEMSVLTGVIALIAAVLNAIRLTGWRGERILRSPILWILHLDYLWLIVGLALKGAAALSDAVPENAALHALTVGAIGTMLLAVMSRAALGPHRAGIEGAWTDRGCVCAHFGCGGAASRRGAHPNGVYGPADGVRRRMDGRVCPVPMDLCSDTRDASTRQ